MKKKKWYQNLRFYRLLTQSFIFLFVFKLVMEDVFKPSEDAITISPEAYCPFGGLESLYLFIKEGQTLSHLHTSNIIILGIIIIITIFFRSGFCGWLCPFGTVQDIIRWIGKKIGSLSLINPLNEKFNHFLKQKKNVLMNIDKYLRFLKYIVLVWVVSGAIYFTDLVFRDYDPFVALIKVTEIESYFALGLLIFVGVLSLFIERPWCKYACPLGAGIGLLGKISPMKIKKDDNLCKNCNLCTKSCPMNIDVTKKSSVSSMECNLCMTCVDNCPVKGALDVGLVLPTKKGDDNNEK